MDKNTATELKQIRENYRKTKVKFVDSKFPADSTSIYGSQKPNSESNSGSEVQWLRPNELRHFSEKNQFETRLDEEWTVMSDLSTEDICQGHLGNCWFISSLAVVAQKPELIEKIILTKEVDPAGVYVIRLCRDGRWHDVIVDDRFPCDKYKRLKYATSRRKQLWVSLIEKAMAKLHGSYEALQAGQSHEGLIALTGYSSHSVELKFEDEPDSEAGLTGMQKKELVWQVFLSGGRAGFLMGASCGKPDDSENEKVYNDVGLQYKHAYSVLDVRAIKGFRLLQLRNPWGRDSFKGDWNRQSAIWTPELVEKLKPPPEDHGIFWISFDDVIRYFTYIDVCQLRYNWHENRFESKFPTVSDSKLTGYYLDVAKPTELELALHQRSTRNKKVKGKKRIAGESKTDMCVAIFTISKSQFELDQTINMRKIGGYSPRIIDTRVVPRLQDGILHPGAYLVLPLSFQSYRKEIAKDFAVSIHSSNSLLVKELSLSKIFLSEALINFTIGTGTKDTQLDGKLVTYTRSKQFAGISIVVENKYSNKWIQVKADFQESENMVSSRESFMVFDSIPPLRRQLIVILTHENENEGYRTAYKLQYRTCSEEFLEDWAPKGANKTRHHPPLNAQAPEEDIHFPRACS